MADLERTMSTYLDAAGSKLGELAGPWPTGEQADDARARAVAGALEELESGDLFTELVLAADVEQLARHLRSRGDASPAPLRETPPPPPATLRDELRAYLRNSRAYLACLGGLPIDVAELHRRLVEELGRTAVDVVDIVPLQGVYNCVGHDFTFGKAEFLTRQSRLHSELARRHDSDSLHFRHDTIPLEACWFALIAVRSTITPAELRQLVGGVDGFRFDVDLSLGRRRFPTGHGLEVERALDPIRLYDWSKHRALGSPAGHYWPPEVQVRYRLHDSVLYRPFHQSTAGQLILHEGVHPHTGEIDTSRPEYWLELDALASGDFVGFLKQVGSWRASTSDVREWVFVERALRYVRKAERSRGYDQFILLVGAVEAALGQEERQLTHALARRWSVLLGDDSNARGRHREAFRAIYTLRSRYVHGDDGPELLPDEDAMRLNTGVRRVFVRLLEWLASLKSAGVTPSRVALLRFLDEANRGDLDAAARAAVQDEARAEAELQLASSLRELVRLASNLDAFPKALKK